ncbi:MAG: GWxTD domain-containing protein [Bacteroidales bacterium]
MKKYIFIFIFFGLLASSFGQKSALRGYLSHASFYAPEHGPYLETYLSILGQSIQFVKNDNGKFQGTVTVTMLFKQNDSIKGFRKYDLKTVEVDDTTHINFIVFDQQRVALAKGNYKLELSINDKNNDLPHFEAKDEIALNFDDKKIQLSDIELIESYTPATESSLMAKSGYDFIPYQDYYYPQNMSKIRYYAEIYNSSTILGDGSFFAVASSIESIEKGKLIENYFRIKREASDRVNIVFNEFDITELPSGHYNLVLSVRDKENKEIVTQSIYFQRSNPGVKYNTNALQNVVIANSFVAQLNQPDTLKEYIRMCFPISSANERLFIGYNLKTGDISTLQQFFLDFWMQRSQVDPEGAWLKYYYSVLGVDLEFGSTNKKGYETDRGRVYLQYGPPNQRIIEPSSGAKPYEIWQYYQYGKQTDLKFVFYTPDRSINDYQLAHSTAIGEIKNVNWQYEIGGTGHKPKDTDNQLFNKKALESDAFGDRSGEYYNIPR